ncbi:helix-turn-helix domain-containing protein [Mycobacterium intermedium]|uniref:helix-turn-helix domain-containing protein n=1 Tax=Mycobacterium intermedium TaxID=28445 RepID=UPI00111BFA51|nr:helix-turn-helix domain-containing protein [Mycobacterium intermedium]MCV6966085.1 helix-turn-helix domain-containing protein [Mycobacterium intermedium]
MYFGEQYDDYLTVEQCAAQLNLSEARVMELVDQRVLKSYGDGVMWVQPALIVGVTT